MRMLRHPSAFLPILMSLAAMLAIVYQLARFGPAPQADEGTPAHIWQLLMVLQVPVVAWFVVRWFAESPSRAAVVLGLHVLGILLATLPVMLLGW